MKVVRPQDRPAADMVAPTVIPKKVAMIKDEAPDVGAGCGGSESPAARAMRSVAAFSEHRVRRRRRRPRPARISVGGNVQAAKLLRQVLPIYPAIAKTAHVSGTVCLHAIIAKDGSIQELQYVSGPALLMKAAMDAVHEWRYQPTHAQWRARGSGYHDSVVFSLGG